MTSKTKKRKQTESKRNIVSCRKLRIALFTHDTYGLGHVKRSMNIIRALAKKCPDASILLVTGCPALHALQDLPPNADCIKIPTVVKTGSNDSQPPHLSMSVYETTLLRTRIVKETILAFSPDVFIVDNFPLGSQAELLPVLQALESTHTKTILGLRDVLDAPEVVQEDWKRQGIYEVLERYYDKILIYGLENIFDAAKNYAIPPCTAKKLRYCGFLTNTNPLNCNIKDIRTQLGLNGSFVLATGGGGGDAYPLLSTFIESMRLNKKFDSVIFTGPLMGKSDRDKLIKEGKDEPNVIIRDFVPDLRPYIMAADVVVTMCGYNMAAEILAYKPQAIVVPRTWKYGEHTKRNKTKIEKEQIFRAQTLEQCGFVHLIEPNDLNAQNLSKKILQLMTSPRKNLYKRINVQGVENAAREIIESALS